MLDHRTILPDWCRDGIADFLLTRMLTTDLDGPGCCWASSPSVSGMSRLVRRLWTGPDSPDLATDQKAAPATSAWFPIRPRAANDPRAWPARQHAQGDRRSKTRPARPY